MWSIFFCCHWSSVKGMVKARKSIDWKYFRNVLPVYRTTALQLWWFTLDNSIMEINSISSCTSYPFLLCHLSSSSRSLIRYVWRWFEFHTRAHNFHQLQNKCTIYISMVAHYPAIINSILCTITHTHTSRKSINWNLFNMVKSFSDDVKWYDMRFYRLYAASNDWLPNNWTFYAAAAVFLYFVVIFTEILKPK